LRSSLALTMPSPQAGMAGGQEAIVDEPVPFEFDGLHPGPLDERALLVNSAQSRSLAPALHAAVIRSEGCERAPYTAVPRRGRNDGAVQIPRLLS
jgi:hypothetical protein